MLVGVCDFPSRYLFPPIGYGGIERWLWAVAVGARQAGADVHLLGPQWRTDLGNDWTVLPVRLEDGPARELRHVGYDLLVVGHEYASLAAWRDSFQPLDADLATFQHWPYFTHEADAFDGVRSRLYCYSPEMIDRYSMHRPVAELAVHMGFDEEEPPAVVGQDLLWLGRIDAEKAPHLAIMAAALCRRRIRVIGPVFDTDYVDRHQALFAADHVDLVGEIGGRAKTEAIRTAHVLVYTTARAYVEAGAAIFGEALRAGTPVAALAWRIGTCADAALCPDTGHVAHVDPGDDDLSAAQVLATAIGAVDVLDASTVQHTGLARFDPARHFRALAARP